MVGRAFSVRGGPSTREGGDARTREFETQETRMSSTMTTGMRKRRYSASGAALLAIALAALPFTSPAHALATTDAAATAPQSDDSGQLDPRVVRRELDNFQAAQISLRQAMTIAEKLHAG